MVESSTSHGPSTGFKEPWRGLGASWPLASGERLLCHSPPCPAKGNFGGRRGREQPLGVLRKAIQLLDVIWCATSDTRNQATLAERPIPTWPNAARETWSVVEALPRVTERSHPGCRRCRCRPSTIGQTELPPRRVSLYRLPTERVELGYAPLQPSRRQPSQAGRKSSLLLLQRLTRWLHGTAWAGRTGAEEIQGPLEGPAKGRDLALLFEDRHSVPIRIDAPNPLLDRRV